MCFTEFKALISFTSLKKKRNEIIPPLHALLQLPLLADLWELFLVVFSHLALLGSASRVVFDALHLLLPRFHQLVVALAKLLLLKPRGKEKQSAPLHVRGPFFVFRFCFAFLQGSAGPDHLLEQQPARFHTSHPSGPGSRQTVRTAQLSTYPLLASMISPLEVQDELLPHRLVSEGNKRQG